VGPSGGLHPGLGWALPRMTRKPGITFFPRKRANFGARAGLRGGRAPGAFPVRPEEWIRRTRTRDAAGWSKEWKGEGGGGSARHSGGTWQASLAEGVARANRGPSDLCQLFQARCALGLFDRESNTATMDRQGRLQRRRRQPPRCHSPDDAAESSRPLPAPVQPMKMTGKVAFRSAG
jgi:hypothetical protein